LRSPESNHGDRDCGQRNRESLRHHRPPLRGMGAFWASAPASGSLMARQAHSPEAAFSDGSRPLREPLRIRQHARGYGIGYSIAPTPREPEEMVERSGTRDYPGQLREALCTTSFVFGLGRVGLLDEVLRRPSGHPCFHNHFQGSKGIQHPISEPTRGRTRGVRGTVRGRCGTTAASSVDAMTP